MASELPATMKALLQYDKEGADNFRITDVPTPTPDPQQVLIRVHAASLNPMDIKRGFLCNDTYPITVGYDVAGVVAALGESVTRFSVGDRVFGDIMRESAGEKFSGTLAEYCVCPADILSIIPENVTFEQAAAVPVAVLTAIQSMETMGVKAGDNVFVSGGAGGVGVHAMQVAKALFGAGHVATTASAAKFDFVKEYGADVIVNYREEDVGEKLKGWADIVMDCVGDLDTAKNVTKEGGKMLTIATPGPGFLMLTPTTHLISSLAKMMEEGKLRVVLDSVHSFSKVGDALAILSSGRAKGKIVVKVVE
ncbi:alcohol dehydrogenase [Gracilaria domingensis]|nr:alcohol dehydrogenase [Gracilaria domingensis]